MHTNPSELHRDAVRATSPASSWNKCLCFRLHEVEYGIDLLLVREIRVYEQPTWLAGAPPSVVGMLNMRSEIVPIIDLRLRFGLPACFEKHTITVVVTLADRTAGLVVDSVSDVLELDSSQITTAPPLAGTAETPLVARMGLVRQGERERMLMLLELEPLLADIDTVAQLAA